MNDCTTTIEIEAIQARADGLIQNPHDFWSCHYERDVPRLLATLTARDERIATLTEERTILAREIAEASQRLGYYNGTAPLTGPDVLLLLQDMEREFLRLRVRGG